MTRWRCCAANTPEMIEAHFGVPMTGAVLGRSTPGSTPRRSPSSSSTREATVLLVDRAFPGVRPGRCAQLPAPARGRHRRPEYDRAGRSARRTRSTSPLLECGGAPVRPGRAGRRVAGHLPELHLRHDGQPQGRRLPPPGGSPERRRQHPHLGHAPAQRLPVDAADVPLQRLVLPLDGGGERGHERLPARGGRRGDLPADAGRGCHALLRRAGRPQPADRRPAELREGLDHDLCHDRGCSTAGRAPSRASSGSGSTSPTSTG